MSFWNWLTRRRDDHGWPNYIINGRIRTSTVALIVAFFVVAWVHNTYQPAPVTPSAPETAVVPPGFVPDPEYTWVPRTNVQERPKTTTTTPTTTTTTTEPTETSPTETTSTHTDDIDVTGSADDRRRSGRPRSAVTADARSEHHGTGSDHHFGTGSGSRRGAVDARAAEVDGSRRRPRYTGVP